MFDAWTDTPGWIRLIAMITGIVIWELGKWLGRTFDYWLRKRKLKKNPPIRPKVKIVVDKDQFLAGTARVGKNTEALITRVDEAKARQLQDFPKVKKITGDDPDATDMEMFGEVHAPRGGLQYPKPKDAEEE